MRSVDSPEVAFAIEAVRRAGHLVRHVQKVMVSPALTKNDRSPVTVGDFAAQALVASLLKAAFPHDPLVAEESAGALMESEGNSALQQVTAFVSPEIGGVSAEEVCQLINRGASDGAKRFWTLDPIDGTKGFLRGEQYAVALALIENGQVVLGALGCPNLSVTGEQAMGGVGSVFVAKRGEGTWAATLELGDKNFQQVQVATLADIHQARLLSSVEAGHTNRGKIDELTDDLHIQGEPVRMDSQAKYAVLACGGGDLLVRMISPSMPDYEEKIWDQAAGGIVVEEAGGRVSDLDGKPLDFSHGRTLVKNRGVLVSNSKLHDVVLEGLKRVGA
jgi:3'(2'), 5'-bisphosphate nucleotidase